jgi:hypothetical protein
MPTPLTPEAAVQRCLNAFHQAWDLDDPNNKGLSPSGSQKVSEAWRFAMPFLTSDPDSIDAFLACVTQGMLLNVLTQAEASKLLYAAQVAISARRARSEIARIQSKSQPKSTTAAAPPPITAPMPSPRPPSNSVTLPLCNSATKNTPTPLPNPATLPNGAAAAVGPTAGGAGAAGGGAPFTAPTGAKHASVEQINAILKQLNSGKIPDGAPHERFGVNPKPAPPTPSPCSAQELAPQARLAPPQAPPTPCPAQELAPQARLAPPQVAHQPEIRSGECKRSA